MHKATTARPPVGTRVRLTRNVSREPLFSVSAGTTGVVAVPPGPNVIYAVRMDDPIDGAEDWDNEIWWTIEDDFESNIDDPMLDLEVIS